MATSLHSQWSRSDPYLILFIDVVHVVRGMSLTEDGTRKGWTSAVAMGLLGLTMFPATAIVRSGGVNLLSTAFGEMIFMFFHYLGDVWLCFNNI